MQRQCYRVLPLYKELKNIKDAVEMRYFDATQVWTLLESREGFKSP